MFFILMVVLAVSLAILANNLLSSEPVTIKKNQCKLHKWEYHEQGFLVCSVCRSLPNSDTGEEL